MTKPNPQDRKYYYTYITRHNNGKYYVGRHSTDDLNDNYLGSGKWVKSIKDKTTLINEIINYYDTYDGLLVAEQLLIEKYIDDKYCMNILCSSTGAAPGEKHHMYGKHRSEKTKKKLSVANGGVNNPMYGKTGELSPNYGRIKSIEARNKISVANSGANNPMYGKSGSLNPMYGKKGELSPIYGEKNVMYGKKGELSPNYGRTYTDEVKQKMSISLSGEKCYRATITDDIARLIKLRLSKGFKVKDVMAEFGVSRSVVSHINSNKTWKHVTI